MQTVNSDLVWLYQLMFQIKESLPLQSVIRSYTSNICNDCSALPDISDFKIMEDVGVRDDMRGTLWLESKMISEDHYGWSKKL